MTILNGINLGEKETHLPHVTELPLLYGQEGYEDMEKIFEHVISGKLHPDQIQIKMDGMPSVFFGQLDGKIFVATKRIFNKEPKIHHTALSILLGNYPPEVSDILILCLELLAPLPEGIIYQAEVMHYGNKNRKRFDYQDFCFQPNIVECRVDNTNDEEEEPLGLCVHTQYDKTGKHFFFSPDVSSGGIRFYPSNFNPVPFTEENFGECRFPEPPGESAFRDESVLLDLKKFKNSTIRSGNFYDFTMENFVLNHQEPRKVRTMPIKRLIRCIDSFEFIKDSILFRWKGQTPGMKFFIDGIETGPEGYIIKIPGLPEVKFVNRILFSYQNFMKFDALKAKKGM